MPDSPTPQDVGLAGGHRRRRRIGAGVAVIAASAAAVGIVLGAGPSSSPGASKPAKASGAATVARRDLVSTDTESGTLGYANPQTVFNRLSGTITSLPTVGTVINPGKTLYDVDSNPVTLFIGTSPAYRDLTAGVSNGPDVFELKQNLKALGFDPDHQITVNQTFDAATTAAVERWQASIGQTQTGTVTLGQIVFLPGPQRITQVETVLGSTGGAAGGSASASAASTSIAVAAPRAEFVDLNARSTSGAAAPMASAKTTNDASKSTKSRPTTCPTSLTKPTTSRTTTTAGIAATRNKIAALCREQTAANSLTAQQTLAALIALLNAETAALKRGSASTGTGSSSATTGARASGTSARSSSSRAGGGSSSGGSSSGGSSSGGPSSGGSASGGSSSGGSSSSGSASGSGSGTAQAILQTTSTQLVVTVQLDATKQSEATMGAPVTVQLPSGDTVDGTITGVSPVAQSASSSSSSSSSGGGGGGSSSSAPSSTVPVTVTLKGHRSATGLDQAAVSVNFRQEVENNVLSVPVTALLAVAGGGYAVREAVAPGRLVGVTPGLFAAGFVQVSGAGIFPGLLVTDSQG